MVTIGYCRVSTKNQEDNTSLENQEKRIRSWCNASDVTLDVLEKDVMSGADIERPGFMSAVKQALQAGHGTTLVFYKLDRFSRDAINTLEVFRMLQDNNIRVVFLEEGIDSASQMGKFMMNLVIMMFAMLAEWEREMILDRFKSGREHAKSNGLKYSKEPRYGLSQSKEEKSVIENADEIAAMWRIRELRDKGLSYQAIADTVSEEGYKPRHGKHWSTSVIYSICNGYKKRVKVVKDCRLSTLKEKFLTGPKRDLVFDLQDVHTKAS